MHEEESAPQNINQPKKRLESHFRNEADIIVIKMGGFTGWEFIFFSCPRSISFDLQSGKQKLWLESIFFASCWKFCLPEDYSKYRVFSLVDVDISWHGCGE